MIHDWWQSILLARAQEGSDDADKGIYDPPYPSASEEDPMEMDENFAYRRGFDKRRRELGDEFTWG